MSCIYGPYKIASSLEVVGEFTFIDNALSRKIAVFVDCAEIVSLPCVDAVALHIEDSCPDGCKILWYECPSEMGRQYTVFPTPCGVKITSFEDGLIATDSCDATQFGSELFCFGKVYTNLGAFDSPDKSATTFEFDGHTFTVTGELSDCSELYDCPECQIDSQTVMTFEDLPTPPEDISAPEPSTEVISDIDTPETAVIPAEGRTIWQTWIDNSGVAVGQDTLCEGEKPLTGWPGGTAVDACESNDNPSIATLPSGHTVVAYENRKKDGITKISVAILSSSVGENIRSHRKLGTGTLINDLVEAEGVATFIVYEDMHVPVNSDFEPQANERIGFLTGPLAGRLLPIKRLERIRSGSIVRHEFKFAAPLDTQFPDKNNVYDVNWFVVDNQDSANLPSSANVTTLLDLPNHVDGKGNAVPVANPSVAVAQNNQMAANEQNIYVAYQAFEDNEWRVYLREIVLGTASKICLGGENDGLTCLGDSDCPGGTCSDGIPPAYVAPYLFDENVRQVEIMAAAEPIVETMGVIPAITFYNETFSGAGLRPGPNINTTGRWISLTDDHIPTWEWFDQTVGVNDFVPYTTMPFVLCDGQGPPGATGLPATNCGASESSCSVVFNSQICSDVGQNDSALLGDHTRSFAVNTTPTEINSKEVLDLSFRMRFHIVLNDTTTEYPEIWFLIGRDSAASTLFGRTDYRLQIRRGRVLSSDSMNSENICRGCSVTNSNCFIFSLYSVKNRLRSAGTSYFFNVAPANGSQDDIPTRSRWKCIPANELGQPGDYSFADWNEWRVDTYSRGNYRFFDIYLTHPDGTEVLMTSFREWDWSFEVTFSPDLSDPLKLGKYHGFGVVQSHGPGEFDRSKHQVLIDNFSVSSIPRTSSEKIIFLEDYCTRDFLLSSDAQTDNVEANSPAMSDEGINTNVHHDTSEMVYRGGARADQFYPFDETNPPMAERSIQLGPTDRSPDWPSSGWSSYLRLGYAAVDRFPDAAGTSYQDAVSMVVSVNRMWRPHDGAWPHVWFVGRLFENVSSSSEGQWHSRYRLRISRFNCTADYPSLGLSQNDQVWRLSAYNSGVGHVNDIAAAELFLKIGVDTDLDWTEYSVTGGGGGEESQSVWNYFKIDMYNDAGLVVFDVYTGDDASADPLVKVHQDDINYSLLGSLSVSPISISTGVDGPYFGLALFSGAAFEVELDGDDYRSSAHLNYISLSTIGAPGSPPTGACCRIIGGCTPDVLSADCQGDDIWKGGQTCAEAACEVDFPVGAGCTSDGICHGGITAAEAAIQGIPDVLCAVGCEWQVGTDCNGGGTDRGCPAAITDGSCCRQYKPDDVTPACVDDVTFEECSAYYGNSDPGAAFRLGVDCTDSCPVVAGGACCLPSGCHITTSAICAGQGGTFYDGHDCTSIVTELAVSCDDGACCDGVGGCTIKTLTECNAESGTFLGVGSDCTGSPCSTIPDIYACCYEDGTCTDTAESTCVANSGTWMSGFLCSDTPCSTPTGACCEGFTGNCVDDITSAICLGLVGHIYLGDGSTCTNANCPQPTGVCCVGSECIEDQTVEQCASLGGSYLSNFTNCIEGTCVDGIEDPYLDISINYKPEDLWVIEIAPEQYVTRVLYHMQEEIIVSSLRIGETGSNTNSIDFMFLIDHSGSMGTEINAVSVAVPALASQMISKGLDVRFGFTFFGRGTLANPEPTVRASCDCNGYMANGLQVSSACRQSTGGLDGISHDNGFTRNTDYLQQALNCWGVEGGKTSPWSAIQYVLEDSEFAWRENASKFIFFVTDTHSNECFGSCGSLTTTQEGATNALIDANAVLIPVINASLPFADYVEVAEASGWTEGKLDVNTENYGDIFEQVVDAINTILRIDHATVMERSASGTDATYLKKGEVIITYDDDLSDLWTFNKTDFEFNDSHVPFAGTNTKQLVNFPFNLASGKIYGIDSVHVQGNSNEWVSFGTEGALIYSHPDVGHRASGTSDTPILISTNSARPKAYVNNRNQVMVAYESYIAGTPQIEIRGTGDFHQNSITGPKANRITRLLNLSDFSYLHAITLPGEGVNQLCDFVIDNSDITHIVWQSSRDGYWEIYYANSFNMFDPVRVTQSESRSSHPSIDVDETGSIFVVYHDDRFGPFNIMLSSKDEERVIPLLEQDAYLASLRTGYTHYTNILPVFLDNPAGAAPILGQFWAAKKAEDAGNDSEDFLYKIDETTGTPSGGADLALPSSGGIGGGGQEGIAFSSTALWGITSEGTLIRFGFIDDENDVTLAVTTIGTIDLDIADYVDHAILDMAVDEFDRIWVLIYERKSTPGIGFALPPSGLPLVQSFTVNHRLRLEYVSGFDASTIARGTVKADIVGEPDGGSLTITPDNVFHITWSDSVDTILSSSSSPSISEGVATFDFQDIGALTPTITPVAMTSDVSGSLFAVSSDNDLYAISKLTAGTILQTSLTSGSGEELSLPVGTTSAIAYQPLNPVDTGTEQFFHLRVDFYDNIALEGDPFLSVDSRNNLEAFINQETFDDPYAIIGMDARGIFLELDQIGIVFFDVTHFVPGFSRLSQPYSFEPNQTYFPRVFQIDEASSIRESGTGQPNSFSCTKCSRFGNNNFNTSACSYSFVMPNPGEDTESFNFQIDFYADIGKQHLIRRFEAIPGSDDLQYMQVDNKPAVDEWTESGLPIVSGDSAFVQIHPVLDPTAGFLCGVTYTVQVNECHVIGSECSNFTRITPFNWLPSLVGDGELIDDQLAANDEVMLGLSMQKINDKLCVAWRTPENFLKFAQFDGTDWLTQVVSSENQTLYCDLEDINGLPSIAHVSIREGGVHSEQVLTLEGGSWNPWSRFNAIGDFTFLPRTLLELDGVPMTVNVTSGIGGQSVISLNSGASSTWDLDFACRPPFNTVSGGSCTIELANINGEPAAALISGGTIRYYTWNGQTLTLESQAISFGDTVVPGKIALVEIDGQPAIAYLKVSGSGAQLKYKRFDGNIWVNTPTGGEIFNFNNHIAMAAINGQPYIVYSIKTSSTTSQLRYTFYNGNRFVDELIEDDLNQIDHIVDIIEWKNEPAVIISANPFRVYFFRRQPSDSVNEIRSVFSCECSSKIFTDRLTHLNEVARWESSAHGFSDTQVTDSAKDSVRPVMKTRKPGAAIVLWEDYNESNNCTDPPCIRAATFRNVNQDQLRASGTKHWFDYDFGISGQDPDIAIDILDRVNSIYEKPKPSSPEGLHGRQLSTNELPGNELYGKVCDFLIAEDAVDPNDPGACDLSSLEDNVVSFDQFISRTIVRKIRVKEDFVQYYTYNASGVLTPIVSTCNIALEIHGTPEIVALRFRNEDKTIWGPWCPWSPQISDFVMERNHKLSGDSGVKEICIQAMTYRGITTEFCMPIVADYETVVFETVFYKSTDSDGNPITNFSMVDGNGNFEADDTKLVKLPLSEGISVANLAPEGGVILNKVVVLVEIVPNQEFDDNVVNFDVLQQGTNDQRGRPANRGKNNEGRVLYRGDFTIEKEDKVSNVDGLARINPTFPSACSAGKDIVGTSGVYTRDTFNEIVRDNAKVESTKVDPLAEFRQTASGRIGVNVDIRSSEDPYFVFGDPDYSLKKEDGQRLGVPFRSAETEVLTGGVPAQEGGCGEPEDCGETGIWDPINCRCVQLSG